ncbi:hypothetical protein [Burkholderia sp. SIMBA_062]|uniref:hypothetical protein n=1 Tax=Burkholderia sp. SIMBA_062 TaxID=3085803 RepID=UPI00397E18FE
MYQDLPFRLSSEGAAETAAEFVRINFRGTGEPLRAGVLALSANPNDELCVAQGDEIRVVCSAP